MQAASSSLATRETRIRMPSDTVYSCSHTIAR